MGNNSLHEKLSIQKFFEYFISASDIIEAVRGRFCFFTIGIQEYIFAQYKINANKHKHNIQQTYLYAGR